MPTARASQRAIVIIHHASVCFMFMEDICTARSIHLADHTKMPPSEARAGGVCSDLTQPRWTGSVRLVK